MEFSNFFSVREKWAREHDSARNPEVFWASDAHFNSYKADIWQLYVVYVYLTYKKGSIKKYYILGILEPY